MTTEEKTSAIRDILTHHQDNVVAARAAQVNPALDQEVTTAMNNALIVDLERVFAFPTRAARGDRKPTR